VSVTRLIRRKALQRKLGLACFARDNPAAGRLALVESSRALSCRLPRSDLGDSGANVLVDLCLRCVTLGLLCHQALDLDDPGLQRAEESSAFTVCVLHEIYSKKKSLSAAEYEVLCR